MRVSISSSGIGLSANDLADQRLLIKSCTAVWVGAIFSAWAGVSIVFNVLLFYLEIDNRSEKKLVSWGVSAP